VSTHKKDKDVLDTALLVRILAAHDPPHDRQIFSLLGRRPGVRFHQSSGEPDDVLSSVLSLSRLRQPEEKFPEWVESVLHALLGEEHIVVEELEPLVRLFVVSTVVSIVQTKRFVICALRVEVSVEGALSDDIEAQVKDRCRDIDRIRFALMALEDGPQHLQGLVDDLLGVSQVLERE
jgi:hypothetical protein